MKKTIAILLVLVIGMVGVFAANQTTATVEIATTVEQFMHIGLTDKGTASLAAGAFDNEADFLAAVETEIAYTEADFTSLATFEANTLIAYVWGLTNSLDSDLTVTISTNGFYGVTDTNTNIPLSLNGNAASTTLTIPKAVGNALGVLDTDNTLSIMETTAGTIALAPAQEYEATVTFEITTV